MNKVNLGKGLAGAATAALATLALSPSSALAADGADENSIEEVVVIGTRRAARSAADTPAPVDVISGEDFTRAAATDVQDLLRTAVPSYNVNAQPISDAATISRPANLRGLSPDNTLVLVNGKRRHRGSVISFLGGGISDGAQGVDVATIPSLALQRVEVLRDGASSQYGSDAIAGVINFVLRDEAEGGFLEVTGGSTYEGDGDNYRIAGNIGLPLGDKGFVNITGEYGNVDGTVRAAPRDDVTALIAAGNTAAADFRTINSYTSEASQYWGQPDVDDDIKLFVNSAFEVNDNVEIYGFGNYAEREVTGGFFYRNPTNRGGVYAGPLVDAATGALDPNGVPSVRVGDLDGLNNGIACPAGIPLTGTDGLIPDAGILAQVTDSQNCFSFVETIPGGFVPRFGGKNEDFSIAGGVRGTVLDGLNYDVSVTHGQNETNFFIMNTLNASLGPDSPRDFVPGGQRQTETVINADFSYPFDVGMASELSVAFGGEYRKEEFDLFAGDPLSFALGRLADQGFSSSSNGFGGFPNSSSNDQDSFAFYVDVEVDPTEELTVQAAVRYEDYSTFGDTTNFKLAGLYRISESFRVRGAFSTGFHAPTAGQANITNVTTQNLNGVLVDQGTLPLNSAAGQLAADFIAANNNGAGRPTLGPEDAENISLGFAFDAGPTTWTVDFYNIKVDDRVALGANVDFLDALNFAGGGANFATVSEALNGLDAAGTINRADFLSLDDLAQFRFFANSFDTETTGIDLVGRMGFDLAGGYSDLTVAANWNKTEVKDLGEVNPISANRVRALEDLLPRVKGSVTWAHTQGNIRGMVRANYFGEWDDTGNGVDNVGAEFLIDVEAAYSFENGLELIGGVSNLFDNFSDKNPGRGGSGQLYPEAGPFGVNGGQWYLKARYSFN